MNIKNKGLLEVHIAVFLFGMAGLFGKLISLPSIIIVFGRVFFSSIFLFILSYIVKQPLILKSRVHYSCLSLLGIVLAVHWFTFFKAIQLSNVAVGLLTFSTFPVFATFLEPYFFKEKIKSAEVIVALITFTGVCFIVPDFNVSSKITQGVMFGILSGLTFAILSILNRKYVKDYSSLTVSFYEQVMAAFVLCPFLLVQDITYSIKDIFLLLLLGIVFTGISHTLFIKSLKTIKAQTASIISCLEPVYGIILAVFVLSELPSLKTLIGGLVILGAAFYSTLRH